MCLHRPRAIYIELDEDGLTNRGPSAGALGANIHVNCHTKPPASRDSAKRHTLHEIESDENRVVQVHGRILYSFLDIAKFRETLSRCRERGIVMLNELQCSQNSICSREIHETPITLTSLKRAMLNSRLEPDLFVHSSAHRRSLKGISLPSRFREPSISPFQAQYSPNRRSA